MAGEQFEPRRISINDNMREVLGRSPHNFYILETHIGDLDKFRQSPRETLAQFPEFQDVDATTNIRVTGIDGDKGDLPTEYIKRTHIIIADFRPLGIEALHWSCTAEWYKLNQGKHGIE